MTTIRAALSISLDGVMQAPGHPDEDRRGGFAHGGWAAAQMDEVAMDVAREGMAREGAMLFGRHTYEHFFAVWAGRDDNPFSPLLDGRHKYVVSGTLREPLAWRGSTLLAGDPVAAVRALKRDAPEEEIVVLGSGTLVRGLLAAGLLDVLQLSIHPLVLGSGTRLFDADGPRTQFELRRSVATTTGVLIATYHRSGA